jgi:hypothetical protein
MYTLLHLFFATNTGILGMVPLFLAKTTGTFGMVPAA